MELIIVKAAPPGIYIAFAVALYIWHVAASLLGVFHRRPFCRRRFQSRFEK